MCKVPPQVKCSCYPSFPLCLLHHIWTQDDVGIVGLVNSDEIGPLFGGRDISHNALSKNKTIQAYISQCIKQKQDHPGLSAGCTNRPSTEGLTIKQGINVPNLIFCQNLLSSLGDQRCIRLKKTTTWNSQFRNGFSVALKWKPRYKSLQQP